MINPDYTAQPNQNSPRFPLTDSNSDRLVVIGSGNANQAYYQQIAQELEDSAQSLLDWHPLPVDDQYVRVAAVQTAHAIYKLADRLEGVAVWTTVDDQPPQLVMSADPNHHVQLLDPELAQDATQTFRAAAIAETLGVYLRSTQLNEWESPSKRYIVQSNVDTAGEIRSLQVNALQPDQHYQTILLVRDNEILLNHLDQDDLHQFRRFGNHLRAQLLQQQYAIAVPTPETGDSLQSQSER